MLRVLYRTVAGDNVNPRPAFYSKELCAASLLRAVLEIGGIDSAEVHVLQDGLGHASATDVFVERASFVRNERRGNGPSWQSALDLAAHSTWPDEDLVYFVEDDYLHHPLALRHLLLAARQLPPAVSYLTLYDHPDLYRAPGLSASSLMFVAGARHWRTVTSTCMTFAATAGTLRADHRVLRKAGDFPTPSDHLMWLALQGGRPERWLLASQRNARRLRLMPPLKALASGRVARRTRSSGARLVAAVPSLASHLDLRDDLSPVVDWDALACDTAAWWQAFADPRLR